MYGNQSAYLWEPSPVQHATQKVCVPSTGKLAPDCFVCRGRWVEQEQQAELMRQEVARARAALRREVRTFLPDFATQCILSSQFIRSSARL